MALFDQHLARVRSALSHSPQTVADWICRYTYLRGAPFNFARFRFQKHILDDPAKDKVIRKPAQVGVSELFSREALGVCLLYREVNCLYILPSAAFAQKFCATRLDPVINASPDVLAQVSRDTDSVSVKGFTNGSFFFAIGASGMGQTISIPATGGVWIDEIDFASEVIVSAFTSRRQAAEEHGYQRIYSTPTVEGWGVSAAFDASKRFVPLHKCQHCGHWFEVDYYTDVVLPGYLEPLATINFLNRRAIIHLDLNESYVACRKCKKPMDLDAWEFVCENPDENFEQVGYQVTPFLVPKVRPPSALIRDSTRYRTIKDFKNNALGKPASDETTGLAAEEVAKLFENPGNYPDVAPFTIAGIDLGGSCAVMQGYKFPDDHVRIYNFDMVPLHQMRTAIPKMFAQYKTIGSVSDILPYTDLVLELQARIPTLWACSFATSGTSSELFTVREKEEDPNKATFNVRQLSAKRDLCLDMLVTLVRAGKLSFAPELLRYRELLITHFTNMKRMEELGKDGEPRYTWKKTTGEDHAFFAAMYMILADYTKGVGGGLVQLPALGTKFRHKNHLT